MFSFFDSNGNERFLGNISEEIDPTISDCPKGCKAFAENGQPDQKLFTDEQLTDTDLNQWAPPIRDQNGVGACNAFSSTAVLESCRAATGLAYAKLWPGHLYGRINGGRDQGSMLEDAVEELAKAGIPEQPVDAKDYDWRTRKPGWEVGARKYRILEWSWCPTPRHLLSALQCGFFLNTGLMWCDRDNPNSDGIIPDRVSGRAGGHAVMRNAKKRDRNGKWLLGGPQTWGDWGPLHGYFWVPIARYSSAIGGFWAGRSVVVADSEIPAIKE